MASSVVGEGAGGSAGHHAAAVLEPRRFRFRRRRELPFLWSLPERAPAADAANAGGDARLPLLVFLHGAGERGDDLQRLTGYGPPAQLLRGEALPFALAAPQCPADSWWTFHLPELDAWLDELLSEHPLDPERVYLTGLSMGGYGTWGWGMWRPQRFAALAPVCGGGPVPLVASIAEARLPVWAFHGDADPLVPVAESERLVARLQALAGEVRFSRYRGVAHDSWTRAYAEPELYPWLLARRAGARGRRFPDAPHPDRKK